MKPRAVILDLDLTLIDSSSLEQFRKARAWSGISKHFHTTSTYDGVLELVEWLREKGLPTGIVTTSPSSYARALLLHHGLEIATVVAYHDVKRIKPDPEPMVKCAQLLGVNPGECITIGDAPNDIAAGRAAGMATVAAMWGCIDESAMLLAGPDFQCTTPNEVALLIQSLL